MERVTAQKLPTNVDVIKVTKEDLNDLLKEYGISVSQFDYANYIYGEKADDEIIGYVAGDVSMIDGTAYVEGVLDLWFINVDWFNSHYKEV